MIISIVIPVYNASLLIERCLNSIFTQQGDYDLEVICIDDGSTDNSVEIIKKYPNAIKLLQQPNSGPAAARNKGIRASTGKYLAFLDADDYWEPNFLIETVKFLECYSEAIAVSVGQIHKIPSKPKSISPKIIQDEPGKFNIPVVLDNFYEFWAENNHVCTGAVLIRTDVAKQTGGQREDLRITEDLEFWAYLATFGHWGFIPIILFTSDGGEITRQQGWLEKNKKRWASAPSVEKWEERIINNISKELLTSFNKAKGGIARKLVYSMIMSERKKMASQTVKKFGAFFPTDILSLTMIISSKFSLTWQWLCFIISYRELHRKL